MECLTELMQEKHQPKFRRQTPLVTIHNVLYLCRYWIRCRIRALYSSGTNYFRVEISNSTTGPWTKIVDSLLTNPMPFAENLCHIRGTCDNTRLNVPRQGWQAGGTRVARYVKFLCDSYHGTITCALHSIQVSLG